jgi:geranylgeranyl diphosphate synthase type II
MDITLYLKQKKELIDKRLDELLPADTEYPAIIHQAMRYSTFAGGKRIRPILTLAACQAVKKEKALVLDSGCAMELIHTYSLIHDDLPAMDDDDFRRGKPTSHKKFGEAIAILAGDALLTMGFQILSHALLKSHISNKGLEIIYEVAQAIGSKGLIGGQVMDLQSEGKQIDLDTILYIHKSKTASLISICVKIGGLLGKAQEDELERLYKYGEKIGLAFQIVDDILDIEGSSDELGKTAGKDQKSLKATFPGVIGLAESKEKASELIHSAINSVEPLGDSALPLIEIARFILRRQN